MRLDQQGRTGTAEQGRGQWPDAVAYREAIQSPSLVIGDPMLMGGQVSLSRQGLPIAYTGRFAVVFRLKTGDGSDWAFRCFTSPADPLGLSRAVRYQVIAAHIASLEDVFVPFRFVERGIRVGGLWYPAIAMKWATGRPLGRWVEENLQNPDALRRLAGALGTLLARLETAGIAHGDWQHDNLIVSDDGAKATLVDYDGLFVPELLGYPSPELGHPNYQHPARSERHYGPGLDRFACLVMQTALLALARDPGLWSRYGDGESLLFKASDLRRPESSRLLADLRARAELDRDSELAESIARLEDALRAGPDSTLLPTIPTAPPKAIDLSALPNMAEWTVPVTAAEQVMTHERWWAGTTSARSSAQIAYQESMPYLEKILSEEALRTEVKHLWAYRAILAGLSAFLIWRGLEVNGAGGWMDALRVLTPVLWLALATAGGYKEWPRRRVHTELDAQLARMRQQISDRREKIQARSLGVNAAALKVARGSAADFVADKMGKLDVNRILADSGIASALDALRAEGIKTALELSRRTNIAGVPPHQIALLQQWCREKEAEFADEYRKLVVQSRTVAADIQRLELEIASFEEEVEKLERQRELLPPVTLATYLKRLVGLKA